MSGSSHRDGPRALLTAQLDELHRRLGSIEAEKRMPADPDSGEQAIEAEDDESLSALERVLRSQVADVAAALQRVDSGTYGHCAGCGRPIGEARLRALPTARKCVECANAD